jgi:hypothetical protein
MTIATAKLSGLITTSLILPHPILTAIACHIHIIMDGCPLCSLYDTVLMLLHACHHLPLVSPEHSNYGEDESGAINGTDYFSQEPHNIHDEMIDTTPGHHPDG